MKVTENAYAKLNLTLEVGAKRPDGYHDLTSVMTSASLYDTVAVEKSDTITLQCDRSDLPRDSRNLAVRAAQAFFREMEIEGGAAIDLKKRIPSEAGLGGGSSDAAAVLRALRTLYAPELSWERLEAIGAQVGSDVPYCVRGGTALAQGRGEKLMSLPSMPLCWYVIVKPKESHSTVEMYAAIDQRHPSYRATTEAVMAALAAGDLTSIAANVTNTFSGVLPADTQIFAIERQLRDMGALNAMMSGSGSAVFGIFAEEAAAKAAYDALKANYPYVFLTQSV